MFWDEHEPPADLSPTTTSPNVQQIGLGWRWRQGWHKPNQGVRQWLFLKDIDFILGLIDKISPQILNYGMFIDLYEKIISYGMK